MIVCTILIIALNALVTYKGLNDREFFDKYSFNIERILLHKDYKGILTSGFLHVNWMHFIFNMISLYSFSIESSVGTFQFLLVYFLSLIGGSLVSLYINRFNSGYTAVGASGAVCGLIFASIALFPNMQIGFILLPFSIPAWIFGIAYLFYTIYGNLTKKDNIGHEAHLGGAITGLLIAITLKPTIIFTNTLTLALIIVPTFFFFYIVLKKPHLLFMRNPFSKENVNLTMDDHYNHKKVERQKELDKLLDKINEKGYGKLSSKEKNRLKELSKQ